jgi:fructokinase
MAKCIAIGEALIDFIPNQKAVALKDVAGFTRVAGGAPANVCACISKLDKESILLTKLGNDAFGDYIIDVLNEAKVNTSFIKRTSEANTGLAFVSLKEDGNRDFSFYRNPSADMLLSESEIDESLFKEGDILHFCSVDLIDAPIRKAHDKVIQLTRDNGGMISFDPNVRLPLWDDHEEYRKVINSYINYADIIKISDEELFFITGKHEIKDALPILFRGYVKVIVYTKGKDGASIFTKHQSYHHNGYQIEAVDTTGSGDSFIGSFIYQLLDSDVKIDYIESIDFEKYLDISNAVGAIVASKKGAISSMPNKDEVMDFLYKQKKQN